MAKQPRYRDAGIIAILAGVVQLLLFADIATRAAERWPVPPSWMLWPILLLVGAGVSFYASVQLLRRAKQQGKT